MYHHIVTGKATSGTVQLDRCLIEFGKIIFALKNHREIRVFCKPDNNYLIKFFKDQSSIITNLTIEEHGIEEVKRIKTGEVLKVNVYLLRLS